VLEHSTSGKLSSNVLNVSFHKARLAPKSVRFADVQFTMMIDSRDSLVDFFDSLYWSADDIRYFHNDAVEELLLIANYRRISVHEAITLLYQP